MWAWRPESLLNRGLGNKLEACRESLSTRYLEVGRHDDFAGRYLQDDGLSLEQPKVPLGVVGQQGPGQQLHQQRVEARLPAGQLHLHGAVPLGQGLQQRPVGREPVMMEQQEHRRAEQGSGFPFCPTAARLRVQAL